MNLLAELTQMLRLHGLYPIPGPQMSKLAPDMEIGHLHIVEKRKDKCVKEDWVSLRLCIERSKLANFVTLMKRHVLQTKAMVQNDKVPSLLELYLTLYTVYLSKARLSITKENPIFFNWQLLWRRNHLGASVGLLVLQTTKSRQHKAQQH